MNRIVQASERERKAIFTEASAIIKIPVEMIEKDFWVCWTLSRLFSSPELKKSLRFKGGTSLSKVYGVIDRFSEDIDLILDWRHITVDDPMADRSATRQDAFNKKLEEKAGRFISHEFKEKVAVALGDRCAVYFHANNLHVLHVQYPGVFPNNYLAPNIQLEIGPLAAWMPHDSFPVSSYVAQAFRVLEMNPFLVPTILAERTFWEKVTILHHEHHRPATSVVPARYSRHYYDLFKLAQSSIKDSALAQTELLTAVVDFKKKFYPRGWARYDLAHRGSIQLLPSTDGQKMLAGDYKAMRRMIYGEYPAWSTIIATLADLEREINTI